MIKCAPSTEIPCTVYTPEYLGCQPIEITGQSPYSNAVLLNLVNGGLSERARRELLPTNGNESDKARTALDLCRVSIQEAIISSGDNRSPLRYGLEAADGIVRGYDADRLIYKNSHLNANKFAEYYAGQGTRTVLKLPEGIRSFAIRGRELSKAINDTASLQGELRFYDASAIAQQFPGLNMGSLSLSSFQEGILNFVKQGRGELPYLMTPKQASEILSLLGGGTLLMALESKNEESDIQVRLQQIAHLVKRPMGGHEAFRLTSMGRTAWGARSVQLRTGNNILPRVTMPMPGR